MLFKSLVHFASRLGRTNLLQALIYFASRIGRSKTDYRVRHVSGETYWNYRLWLEGVVIGAMSAALFFWGVHPTTDPTTSFAALFCAGGLTLFGLLEVWRLLSARKAQIEFAELFYG